VGTIDVDPADPLLLGADEAVREAFDASLGRPLAGTAHGARHGSRKRPRRG
jgi:hypothetical protein